jgi:two-component system, LytTR family, response regulator
MKIIVVDDEAAALTNFLSLLLDRQDIESQMFQNDPLAAIPYCENHEVDAAYLDIRMPQIDGKDLAERLIKVRPDIAIFFITSFQFDEASVKKRIGSNFHGFCYKPFSPAKMKAQLNKLVKEKEEKRDDVFIQCVEGFDVFKNGVPLDFRNSKSKELLALGVAKSGGTCLLEEACDRLYPEKEAFYAKKSYRDCVFKLRRLLAEAGLDDLVSFQRGSFKVNRKRARCDYWDILDGTSPLQSIVSLFPNYDWSAEYEACAMDILENKPHR